MAFQIRPVFLWFLVSTLLFSLFVNMGGQPVGFRSPLSVFKLNHNITNF